MIPYRLKLGADYDRLLHAALAEVLESQGGVHKRKWWLGPGGALPEPQRYEIRGSRVVVRADLWEGTFLIGRRKTVEELAQLVGRRLGKNTAPPWLGSVTVSIGGLANLGRSPEIRAEILRLGTKVPGDRAVWVEDGLREGFEVWFEGVPIYYLDYVDFGPFLCGDKQVVESVAQRVERSLGLRSS